jgi:hypothetical protein
VKLRDELLELRARIDGILGELPAAEVRPVWPGARYMKIPAYATAQGLSPRTIRDYCELGMPHDGEGHNRRVLAHEADAWIANGGPRKARMARKAS